MILVSKLNRSSVVCLILLTIVFPEFVAAQQSPRPGHSILEYTDGKKGKSSAVKTPDVSRKPIAAPKLRPSKPRLVSKPIAQSDSSLAASLDASDDLNRLLTNLVLDSIPHTFEEDKDWGGQSERWDGIRIRRDGLKLETKRKKKKVNHGTWKKYSVWLLDPNEQFSVEVKKMRELPGEKVAFEVHCAAHLGLSARQSKWVKGVQLYSLSAKGHTKIRLAVAIELQVSTDAKVFPPDLVFEPVATSAELYVDEFRIDRVGKAGGEIAQQVTKGVRRKLDEKIEAKEKDLVSKINRQLKKKQDKLRLSVSDAMKSKWTTAAKAFMPAGVVNAMNGEGQ